MKPLTLLRFIRWLLGEKIISATEAARIVVAYYDKQQAKRQAKKEPPAVCPICKQEILPF